MSVFVLSPAEFGAVAATLRTARDGLGHPLLPVSFAERWEHKTLVEPLHKQPEEDYALSLIDPFVYRLYLANVMAERYTYMKGGQEAITIPLIDLPKGRPTSLHELRKTLDSLSSNLVTNGGNTFLGVKDDEKLRELIEKVKTELIEASNAA